MPDATALVLIDLQNDYFPGGAFPLPHAVAAGERAAALLTAARGRGIPVVHVQHQDPDPESFLAAGTEGAGLHEGVTPADGEPVVQKQAPNAFLGTTLDDELAAIGATGLVVAGMMSNMCVDATVRAALDAGFAVTVAHDACAAADIGFDGRDVPAQDVHAAFLGALGHAGARVVPVAHVWGDAT
jgi:nicotinamidase-related amidase